MTLAMGGYIDGSKASFYAVFSVGLAVYALCTYPVGKQMDKAGSAWILPFGAIVSAVSLFSWAHITNISEFYLVFIGIGIAQATTLYEPVFALLIRNQGVLKAKKSIVFITVIAGLSSTLFFPLLDSLITENGWRNTLKLLALLNLFVTLPIYCYVYLADKKVSMIAKKSVEKNDTIKSGVILSHPLFAAYAVSFMMLGFIFSGMSAHIYPLLIEREVNRSDVILLISLIGPAQIFGRLLMGMKALRELKTSTLAVIALLHVSLVFSLFLIQSRDILLITLLIIVYGVSIGIMIIVKGLAALDLSSIKYYGQTSGLLTIPILIAQAASPWLISLLWEIQGSYYIPVIALICTSIISATGFMYVSVQSKKHVITYIKETKTLRQ